MFDPENLRFTITTYAILYLDDIFIISSNRVIGNFYGNMQLLDPIDIKFVANVLESKNHRIFCSGDFIFLDHIRNVIINPSLIDHINVVIEVKNGHKICIDTSSENGHVRDGWSWVFPPTVIKNIDNRIISFIHRKIRTWYIQFKAKRMFLGLYQQTLEKRYQPGGEGFNEALVDFQSATKNV